MAHLLEGVLAVNKPAGPTSAAIVRQLQASFGPSELFAPNMIQERKKLAHKGPRQRRGRRRQKEPQLKIGHGGTLDPDAMGVLIIGIGQGTKALSRFTSCTKTYETVVLFGAATDTYDASGRVLSRASTSHITREAVEHALDQFRGAIMQTPPIFSALRINGKRLYEYAREAARRGEVSIPVPVEARPVTVEKLEIIEWLEPGNHPYELPQSKAVNDDERIIAETMLGITDNEQHDVVESAKPEAHDNASKKSNPPDGKKRRRSVADLECFIAAKRQRAAESDSFVRETETSRRIRMRDSNPELMMTGALIPKTLPPPTDTNGEEIYEPAPAVKIRMTVSSGFYVRSLCHDLGKAIGSLGLMAHLVRTKQAEFDLNSNVLNWEDVEKGEEIWGPKVKMMLQNWNQQNNKLDDEHDQSATDSKDEEAKTLLTTQKDTIIKPSYVKDEVATNSEMESAIDNGMNAGDHVQNKEVASQAAEIADNDAKNATVEHDTKTEVLHDVEETISSAAEVATDNEMKSAIDNGMNAGDRIQNKEVASQAAEIADNDAKNAAVENDTKTE